MPHPPALGNVAAPCEPLLALLFTGALAFSADEVDTPKTPKKNDDRTPKGNAATQTPENAMKNFAVAPGLQRGVWAAEPLLANPVAFAFDDQGRAFVAETYRRRTSRAGYSQERRVADRESRAAHGRGARRVS